MPKRRRDHQPLRTCAVCREVHPKRSMIRLVRQADGSVAVDPSGKAAGRGTYLCDQPSCREAPALTAGVARALGTSVQADELVAELTHASA